MTEQTVIEAPVERSVRQGFLPFATNTFDRYFISVIVFVAVHLLYMRLIEPLGAPLWLATILTVVLGFIIVRRG